MCSSKGIWRCNPDKSSSVQLCRCRELFSHRRKWQTTQRWAAGLQEQACAACWRCLKVQRRGRQNDLTYPRLRTDAAFSGCLETTQLHDVMKISCCVSDSGVKRKNALIRHPQCITITLPTLFFFSTLQLFICHTCGRVERTKHWITAWSKNNYCKIICFTLQMNLNVSQALTVTWSCFLQMLRFIFILQYLSFFGGAFKSSIAKLDNQ